MAYVDLHELEHGQLEQWPLFSTQSALALTSLLPRDHMVHEDRALPLSVRVRDFVERHTAERPTGRIRLLTNLRICGVEFNPVSFYYIFDHTDTHVELVVAEVANFPWLEQHPYLVKPEKLPISRAPNHESQPSLQRYHAVMKEFHVSPFLPIDHLRYHWLISDPVRVLRFYIIMHDERADDTVPLFHVSLNAERLEWSPLNLVKMQCRFPMHSVYVMMAILYEAGKLLRGGFTFFPHPDGASGRLSTAIEQLFGAFTYAKSVVASLGTRWRVPAL